MQRNFKCEFLNMEDQNVAIRLKGFIDSQGLSHSQFSDKCGIPRPSLSQIISGRNKKVSDVIVSHIHKAFPQLSILWLLFGEGPMLNSLENSRPSAQSDENIQFSENPDDSIEFAPVGDDDPIFDDTIFGDSSMFDNTTNSTDSPAFKNASTKSGVSDANFSGKNPVNTGKRSENSKFSNVNALNATNEALQVAKKQLVDAENKVAELQLQIDGLRKNPRKVSHITVYYDDSTFETFVPNN